MESRVLEHWGDFYLLLGTAAAALLALLFVAVSLGAGFLTEQRAAATRAFFSPIVVHFAVVLFLSAIALVPSHRRLFFVVLIGGTGLVGLGIALTTTIQIDPVRGRPFVLRLAAGARLYRVDHCGGLTADRV